MEVRGVNKPLLDREKAMRAVRELIEAMGLDPDDENFKETPRRVADFLEELIEPKISDEDYVKFTTVGNLVIVRGIRAYSLCPHHLLPVVYDINVAYVPNGKAIGLSKIARLAVTLAGKPMLQEDFTELLADEVTKLTGSKDIMVVVKGVHFCMRMRGIKQQESNVVTSAIRGEFKDMALRSEALRLMEI